MIRDNPLPRAPDDAEDRSVRELDFSEERVERQGRIGDQRPAGEVEKEFPPERVAESGMTGGETLTDSEHEDNVTLDDLSPDTLYDLTGTSAPADADLRRVDESEIGGGIGLDEAELGRSAPLDGKLWTDKVSPAGDEEE
ncbi:phosphotransferase system, HPr-related protein [Pseudomonas sp. BN417]|uniref:phosphotransferase system, HPr-related protein n=1 Tax=Pseudomonas sp. BN417 TaxID=2567890 RepID=UPI002453A22E|nr:phosphotransferase system, HPr-related protein [Pseudomonas sp. BN417]MDH4557469.1 phosphotransferase system, HPr-related protein [Pseudomonas sp. BN417]